MAITLTDLGYDSGQNPVGVDKPFNVTIEIDFDPADQARTGVVKLWTLAAYAVIPNHVDVQLAPNQQSAAPVVSLKLQGNAQQEIIRIYAECDERHSFFVRVA